MGWQQFRFNTHPNAHTVDCMQHAHFRPPPELLDSSSAQTNQHVSRPSRCVLSPPLYSTTIGCVLPELHPSKDGQYACEFLGHNFAQTALFGPSSVPTGPPPPWLPRKVLRDFSPRLAGFQAQKPTFRGSSPCKSVPTWPFTRFRVVSTPSAGPRLRSLASRKRPPRRGR